MKWVVYIRKVKKSESKSQHELVSVCVDSVVYIRKVKKSESKSQHMIDTDSRFAGCVYP